MTSGKEILDDALQASLNEIWETATPYKHIEGEVEYFQSITKIIQSILGIQDPVKVLTYKSRIYLPIDYSISVIDAAESLLKESIDSSMDITPIYKIISSGSVIRNGVVKFAILIRYYA